MQFMLDNVVGVMLNTYTQSSERLDQKNWLSFYILVNSKYPSILYAHVKRPQLMIDDSFIEKKNSDT